MENIKSKETLDQFNRVQNLMTAHKRSRSAEYNGERIHGSELQVLELLGERPMIKITEVAETLYITASAASQLVKKLNLKGLIVKQRNLMNERIVHLTLSPAGKEFALLMEEEAKKFLNEQSAVLSELSNEEIRGVQLFLLRTEEMLKNILKARDIK